MNKILLAAIIVFASAGTASAGGQPGSIGVGAEFQISGIGGLSANFDAGKFHVGGFIGFFDPNGPNNTTVDIGGRFFFHVASTAMSDFSVGGGLGIQSIYDNPGTPNANRLTNLFLEPSFQIRAFLASNVALSFTAGIEIGTVDASEVNITGNISGEAGIHYYF
ncbi:MAG TPA: hypothetical protein VHN14_04955 [Kofleriaceae bacterium]|nr:hypothetical protein [Kofleriaceae bacterium]